MIIVDDMGLEVDLHHKREHSVNGHIMKEFWYYRLDGFDVIFYHRPNGPAIITYYENANVMTETWYRYNNIHREDGPAHTSYGILGMNISESWFINGFKLEDKDIFYIKRNLKQNKILAKVGLEDLF